MSYLQNPAEVSRALWASNEGAYHLQFPDGHRVLSWESVRLYVTGRGGCPCTPGDARAFDHLKAAANGGEIVPDATVAADYGCQGKEIHRTVGAWATVLRLLGGVGALKPSPRKTTVVAIPSLHQSAEITWLPRVSPTNGERLFEVAFFAH
jgi:hypothetical protein